MKKNSYQVLESFHDGEIALIDTHNESGRYIVAHEYQDTEGIWVSADYFHHLEDARKEYAKKTILTESILKAICIEMDIDPLKNSGLYRSLRETIEYSSFDDLLHPDFVRNCQKEKDFEQIRNTPIPCIRTEVDLADFVEDLGWNLYDGGDFLEIAQESPAGEDFTITVPKGETLEDTIENICDLCMDYDADDHVELWAESAGKNGVPDISTLDEDSKDIGIMLEELKYALERCEVKKKEREDRTI